MNKNLIIIAAVLAAAGFGIYRFAFREPPDITEDQAKVLSGEGLKKFCSRPTFNCADFALAAQETPTDKRFHWAFRFENTKPDPAQRVFVSIGRKGERSVEATMFPNASGKPTAVASAAAPAKTPAAALGAPAKMAGLVSSPPPGPLGWTLCELPPKIP